MVVCKYFQQGNCRFGSKCLNEHIDLKQLVKADTEASINGKQWPFSCYGPFKDKPCLPNFVEDKSFEEVRLMCYEAKQKNFFEQFHHQFNAAALEANGKMKALLQFTPDLLNMITALYESTTTTKSETLKSNNPFDLSGVGGHSMLNKTNGMNTNIFGISTNHKSSNNSTGMAQGSSGGNLFTTNSNSQSNQVNVGNFFGSTSVFSQSKEQQQQTSIFGQPVKQNTSIFSAAKTNNAVVNAPFSTYNQTINLTGGNIFGQTQSLQQQQLQQQQHQQQCNTNTFGLFSQAAATATVAPQQQTLNQSSVFSSNNQNLFNQASSMQQQQNYSTFGQANQQPHLQQQQTSLTNQNLFIQPAQPNNTIFGMQQSTMEQQQCQQQQPKPQQQFMPSALTLQANTQQQQCQNDQTIITETVYSRLDELSAEEIEAFKSNEFQPGKIPFNPPPKELIN